MSIGIMIDVPAPIEFYDAVHAEVLRRTGAALDGLLLHLARPTDGGFQVVEVWESREHAERYDRELIGPVLADFSAGQAAVGTPVRTEFEVRGLVVPTGGVAW